MDLELAGKKIIVTGGSSGLGLACAKVLLQESAEVILVSRNTEGLEQAAVTMMKETGKEPDIFAADVSVAEQIGKLKQWFEEQYGTADGLIINTGGPPPGGSLSLDDKIWMSAFEANLLSVVRLSRAFVPAMRKQQYGRIVAIASSSVKQVLDNMVLSNTTRTGLAGYLRTLANEVAGEKVLVNTLLPGPTRTQRLETLMQKKAEQQGISLEEVMKKRVSAIPMGRFGEPEELANFAAFLLSGKNSYITGQVIAVDGGYIQTIT